MQQATSRLTSILGCFTLIFIFFAVGHAQFRAAIQGVVTDPSGATIGGATVTLTSSETNQSQTTTTSDQGFYRFSNLAPGLYTITVEQQGFKKGLVSDVKVDAEVTKGQDITLETGGISETVTVQAEVAELQTEDASVRRTITNEEVIKLPQQGRDPYELVRLTPGIFGSGARSGTGGAVNLPNTSGPGGSNNSIFQTENQVPISANGQRVTSNNFQVDGTSANSQTWGGAAIITPSQESVKELQVSANSYSAEDGRNSGAQIKVITQNGTNDWHGSLFFRYDDPSLNAFNTFPAKIGSITTVGPQKVTQKFRSYGGSVGGPLPMFHFGSGGPMFDSGKNRLFFFFAYEGTKNSTNVPYITWAESPQFRQQLLALRPGTVSAQLLGSSGIEPRLIETLAPTPVGNTFACSNAQLSIPGRAVGGGVDIGSIAGTYGQYLSTNPNDPTNIVNGGGLDNVPDLVCGRFAFPQSSHANQYFARIDLNATDKDRIAVTSITTPSKAQTADSSAQSRPQADLISDRLNFAVALIYNRTFSSTMTNEARFSYSGWGFDELNTNPNANFGLPRVEIEQIWGDRLRFGAQQPGVFKDRQYDFRDTVTKIIGNHVVKVGVAFRHDVNKGGSVSVARPLFSFVRPWEFANGTPVFEQISADANGNPVPNTTVYHTNDLAFFGQDDWKFRPNITLNLGLRWEYFSPITVDTGVIGNLIPGPDGGLAGAHIDTNKKLTDSDYNNFGPQLGLAWMPDRFKNKMVVRTGFGISYDRLANALLDNARRNPPAGQNFGICCAFSNSDLAAQQIVYAASTNGGITGYPRQPNIGGGLNPANGLPQNGSIEIYAAPRNMPTPYLYRYSLDVQYELPFRTVASVGYTGSAGRHYVRINPLHITGPSQNPNIFAAYFASPDVNTNYNALISSVRTRFYKGLTAAVNYTFGKSLDNASFEAPCGCTNQSFPVDQKEERGRSDFDVRHNIVASAIWDLPFFTDQKSWEGKVLGGWQVSTIVTYNTGFPWTPKLFGCLQAPSAANFCDPRPTFYNGKAPLANTNSNFLQPGGIFPGGGGAYFNTSVDFNANPFANRPAIGRNSLFGPKYFDTDLSIVKRFGLPNIGILGEGAGVDLRVNFFNVFNNLNLAPFNSNSDPTRVTLATFGTATNGLAGRVGELQIRFNF